MYGGVVWVILMCVLVGSVEVGEFYCLYVYGDGLFDILFVIVCYCNCNWDFMFVGIVEDCFVVGC